MAEQIEIFPDRILSPEWFNRNAGKSITAEVIAATLIVDGESFSFRGEAPPDGRVMRVTIGRRFQAEMMDDYHRRLVERDKAKKAEATKRRTDSIRRRECASYRNEKLNIPVRWDTATKPVLSGLLRNSHGDGLNRASVIHVMVNEPLTDGRLKRTSGALLCGGVGEFTPSLARHHDYDGKAYAPAVTCKRCLTLAGRWIEESGDEQDVPIPLRYQSSSP
jgi:hypothetical protein